MATWAITKAETNFARLTIALLKVCADLLREVLLRHIPNRNIQTAIATNKKKLKPLLNNEQKGLLFPKFSVTFIGSVADFDISLLYLLLRNISTVPVHGKGWGKPPADQPRDSSIGANVERIRLLRNKISGHSVNGNVPDADFESLWNEIQDCVQDLEKTLNLQSYMHAMAKLKVQDLDPQFAARNMDEFKAQLTAIHLQQKCVRNQATVQQQHIADIKQDIDQLQSQQDDQGQHLTDIRQNIGQLQSQRTAHGKQLTDITHGMGQLQSQQTAHGEQLTDMAQSMGQFQSQQANQGQHLAHITQDIGQLQSQQADQRQHLTDITQGMGQLQSQQTAYGEKLTDITHNLGQQADQLKRFCYREDDIVKVASIPQRQDNDGQGETRKMIHAQTREKQQEADFRNKARGRRKRGTRCPFFMPWCANVSEEGFATPGFDLHRVRSQLIDIFMHSYQFIPTNPFDPNSSTNIAFVFTELEIEDYDTEYAWEENVDRIRIREFENLLQFSSSIRKASRIYLEGKAGSGKTVYACKLITDWCNIHQQKKKQHSKYLLKFDICIPVSLHNVRDCKNVEELLQTVLGDCSGINIVELAEYILNKQEQTLIVMDGLDEYRDNSSVVDDIIQRKALPGCTVVVSSRPWKIQNLSKGRHIDRRARILGFSEDNVVIYAQRVFQHIFGKSEKSSVTLANDLKKEIKEKRLVALSKIPLILLFMCYLWVNENTLANTETEIYSRVLKCMIGNYTAKENRRFSIQRRQANLKNIDLDEKRELFITLGEVAYRGLAAVDTKGELMFDEEDLNKHFNQNHIQMALKIGLLSEQKSFSVVSTTSHLSFLHLSIQEFFTAYLYVHSERSFLEYRLPTMLKPIKTAENFENVLKFIVGIDQNQGASAMLMERLVARCLIAHKMNKCCKTKYLKLFFRITGEYPITTTVPSQAIFGMTCKYCFDGVKIKITPNDWKTVFASETNAPSLDTKCTQLHIYSLPALNHVMLEGVTMDPKSWQAYFALLSKAIGVQSIEIKDCSDLSNSMVEIPTLPVLTELKLECITMNRQDCKIFFGSLGNAPKLKNLVFKGSKDFIDMSDCHVTVPKLPELTSLKFVNIIMNRAEWQMFCESMVDNTPDLQDFALSGYANSSRTTCQQEVNVFTSYQLHTFAYEHIV